MEETIKKIAVDFFRYWWNTSRTNTEQGFDGWWIKNKSEYIQPQEQEKPHLPDWDNYSMPKQDKPQTAEIKTFEQILKEQGVMNEDDILNADYERCAGIYASQKQNDKTAKVDISLLRDAWSECWGASARAGYSIDKMQKEFEDWLDSRKINWRV